MADLRGMDKAMVITLVKIVFRFEKDWRATSSSFRTADICGELSLLKKNVKSLDDGKLNFSLFLCCPRGKQNVKVQA